MVPTRVWTVAVVVVPEFAGGRALFQGSSMVLAAAGVEVISIRQPIDVAEETLRRMNVDGILVPGWRATELAAAHRITPVVVSTIQRSLPLAATVAVDNDEVGAMAAEALMRRGLSRLLFVTFNREGDSEIRFEGFRRTGEGGGARVERVYVPGVYVVEERRAVAEQVMEGVGRFGGDGGGGGMGPVGVLAFNDYVGVAVMRVARENGLSVPGDLFVVGIDDDADECNAVRPTLSSMDLNYRQVGRRAGEMILDMLRARADGVAEEGFRYLRVRPAGIVERESTRGVATTDPVLAEAMGFLRAHAMRVVTAEEVAEHVGRSRRWLDGSMKAAFGRTAAEEVMQLRLEHAARLLRDPAQDLGAVSAECGFKALSHFCRAFKSRFRATPTQWRGERTN